MSSPDEPVLVLWDIDQTLLTVNGVSRRIYERAFEQVLGRELRQVAGMAGRTERAILTETLAMHGVTATDDLLGAFYTALGANAHDMRDQVRDAGRALPGAARALAALERDGAVQSVVTGNIPALAAIKLQAFGLDPWLDLAIGGYGDEAADRAVLVRLAHERAQSAHGTPIPWRRVVVIGDTPHDVTGAHDAGALAIAVASGYSTISDLAGAGADAVLPDLADTAALRAALDRLLPRAA